MMHSGGFDHENDVLPGSPDDPATTGEPTSFHLDDGIEVLYVPGDSEYYEIIERPSANTTPSQGPTIGPG